MDVKGGAVLGVCVVIAALIVALVPRPAANQPASHGPQVGRYLLGGVPGHAYVIDTATGQVWEKFATTGEGTTHPDFNDPKVK
jgi:hypothetical protein